MRKIKVLLSVSALSVMFTAHALPTYKPTDMEQFEKTNQCTGCDLSSAPLSPNHSSAILNYANLSNVWSGTGQPLNFSNSDLRHANLSNANLKNANFSNADLTCTQLYGANIDGANFFGAKVTKEQLKTTGSHHHVIAPDGSHFK